VSEAVFRAHIEQIWNNKDISAIERFISRDYRGFNPAEPEPILGVEGYKQHFRTLTAAFPDIQITFDDIFEGEGRTVARFVARGTHRGDFGGIPPTGRRFRVGVIAITLIPGSQLVEEHALSDVFGLMKQIGVIDETLKVPSLLF